MSGRFSEVASGVFCFSDSCNVYVVTEPSENGELCGIAIDFGSGEVLDHLGEIGLSTLDAVLMTHHQRDQGYGLPGAVSAGIPIWVPPVEFDLFARVDELWATRPIFNDYNLWQDRFSLLEPILSVRAVAEYQISRFGVIEVRVILTPGHTMGSVSYLISRGDRVLAFSGDLIYAPGKVWSLAVTQWSYTENEGPAITVLSCYILMDEEPSLLLPWHGSPIAGPVGALSLLAE